MDRRKALKNIGTGIGAIAVTPTVVGFFQSCQSAVSYTPVFVPQEDFGMLSSIMDLIIPSTDTPGAIELKLPEFIDAYADGVLLLLLAVTLAVLLLKRKPSLTLF